jgi:hypothetical protein
LLCRKTGKSCKPLFLNEGNWILIGKKEEAVSLLKEVDALMKESNSIILLKAVLEQSYIGI